MGSLDIRTIVEVGGILVAFGGSWFLIRRNAFDIQEIWKIMTKLRDWQSTHERESGDKRSEYDRSLAIVSKDLGIHKATTEAQNRYMTERLDSIDKKLDRLIEGRKKGGQGYV